MDFLSKKEYDSLLAEMKNTEIALKSQQYIFEQQLKNGLGDEIRDYIKNPPKPDKKLERKIRLAKKWNDFKEKLDQLLFKKSE